MNAFLWKLAGRNEIAEYGVERKARIYSTILVPLASMLSTRYDKNHPSAVSLDAFDGAQMEPHVFREQLKRVRESIIDFRSPYRTSVSRLKPQTFHLALFCTGPYLDVLFVFRARDTGNYEIRYSFFVVPDSEVSRCTHHVS